MCGAVLDREEGASDGTMVKMVEEKEEMIIDHMAIGDHSGKVLLKIVSLLVKVGSCLALEGLMTQEKDAGEVVEMLVEVTSRGVEGTHSKTSHSTASHCTTPAVIIVSASAIIIREQRLCLCFMKGRGRRRSTPLGKWIVFVLISLALSLSLSLSLFFLFFDKSQLCCHLCLRWRGMRVGDRCRQRPPQLTDSLLPLVMRRLVADALHDDLDVSAHRVGLSDDGLHLIDETAESRPSLFVFHLQTSTRSDC